MTKVIQLNRKTFENSFKRFQKVEHKTIKPENYQISVKFKEFTLNGKIGTAGQKDRLTF